MRVLLVEDDADFRDTLCGLLNLEGFAVNGVGSIASYKAWRQTHSCDALIIDRGLPDGDGLEVVRLHRQTEDSPLILLSGKGTIQDRVAAMQADADYYFVKPVAIEELVALLRRLQRRQASTEQAAWLLDLVTWRLRSSDGTEIALTRKEVEFLSAFVEKPGFPIARSEIIQRMGYDPVYYDPRRLEILVRRLRKKVEAGSAELPLSSVYGVGFAFNCPLSLA